MPNKMKTPKKLKSKADVIQKIKKETVALKTIKNNNNKKEEKKRKKDEESFQHKAKPFRA